MPTCMPIWTGNGIQSYDCRCRIIKSGHSPKKDFTVPTPKTSIHSNLNFSSQVSQSAHRYAAQWWLKMIIWFYKKSCITDYTGANILHNSGKLFRDENAQKLLTLLHLLSIFQECLELFQPGPRWHNLWTVPYTLYTVSLFLGAKAPLGIALVIQ